jgi:hypothetical protein
MADYTKVAVYELRNVLWQELQNANLFNYNDYFADGFEDNMVPIIPAQQVPEFNNLLPGRPYIIYDTSQRGTGVAWWMTEEVITMSIVSRDTFQIQTVINFITDVFRRYDKSAKEVQLQLSESSLFKFHYFKLEASDPVQAFTDEGGFMMGTISIVYSYSRDLDSDTGRYL